MRVLITGAAGLVGSHLASVSPGAIALGHAKLDITDAEAVRRLRADVIFNCAVIGVDQCEADPELAERVNVEGPANLARAAERIVHFSTNYVFDGHRTAGLYGVEDAAHPINVYGATKLRGERAVLAASPRALIIRTSWVYGPGKDSFLSTVAARLARGERVQAITDTFASTTYVHDLVARVMELVQHGASGIHHVVNDGICSYETFALEAARLAGASPDLIDRASEASHARPAPPPALDAAAMPPADAEVGGRAGGVRARLSGPDFLARTMHCIRAGGLNGFNEQSR
jgi:dTDP-4-dehydrorhamnose reductase